MLGAGAEIGLDHRFVLHDLVGRALGQNRALGHHDDRVAETADEVHVVLDDAEGVAALGLKALDDLADRGEKRAVHACADFVEEDDLGVHHHRAAELQELLLAAGEVFRPLVREVGEGEEVEHLVRLLAQRLFVGGDAAGAKPGVDEVFPRLRGRHHHQILAHRQRVELLGELKGAQQAAPEELVRGEAGDVLAVQPHGAGGRRIEPGDDVEERRLAGAVGADQPGDGAAPDRQRHVTHGVDAAEPLRQAGDGDHRIAGRRWGDGRGTAAGCRSGAGGLSRRHRACDQRYCTVSMAPSSIAISRKEPPDSPPLISSTSDAPT
ncbi:membrane associated protein [Stappia sp. 22II-S9-Z10]|nr:membrane associated protein [Stappia sp. 22II-S9-Z10]